VKVDQTGPDPNATSNGTPEGRIVGGIAEFGNDIATLAELQAKLALADLNVSLRQASVSMAMIVVGLVVVLGSVPVILGGVAQLLAVALKISGGWASVLTGGVALILAVVVVAIAARQIGPSFSSFRRTREELNRNLSWIRTVLLYSGRSVPRRTR